MRKMTKDVMVYVFKNCFLKKIVTSMDVEKDTAIAVVKYYREYYKAYKITYVHSIGGSI